MNETGFIKKLEAHLPTAFDFYHQGTVELIPTGRGNLNFLSQCHAVAFKIFTDESDGYLILTFDRHLDFSTYSEMGNIIASQIATRLGENAMISAPTRIKESQIRRVLKAHPPQSIQPYQHLIDDQIHRLHAILIESSITQEMLDV